MEAEAFARLEMGIGQEEFLDLVPAQWAALCEALRRKKREQAVHFATIVAAVYNSAGKVSKETVTVASLIGDEPPKGTLRG